MDRKTATSIMALAVSMDKKIGGMFDLIDLIDDQELKAKLYKAVTDLMGRIAMDIIFPIEEVYPDLNPDN